MLKKLALTSLAMFLIHCSDALTLSSPTTASEPTTPASDAADTKMETKSASAPEESESTATGDDDNVADRLPETSPGQWTWLGPEEFGNAPTCMDGSKTGLGLSRSPTGSKKLLIFMEGGGACFDGQTCALADKVLAAEHKDASDFDTWKTTHGVSTIMNRDRAENPFREYNFVYVPYCSGDVFSGSRVSGFKGRPQIGFKNVAAYLPRLKSTFRDSKQVVLSGTSAGGYGAAYNYVQVQKAFEGVDLTVIDDSGPPFTSEFTPTCLQEKWKNTWGMADTSPVQPFPIGLDPKTGEAGGGLFALIQALVKQHPKSRFAFLTHEADIVMRYFHGIGHSLTCGLPNLMGKDAFADGLREVRTIQGDNFLTYYAPGLTHQFLKDDDSLLYDTEVDGVSLPVWLGQVVSGASAPTRVPAEF